MFSTDEGFFKKVPVLYWVVVAALLAVAFMATWSCSAWKSEAEIKQIRLNESLASLEQANTEIGRLDQEVVKGNRTIQQQNLEITRLGREVNKANQIIQQQQVALECYAQKSNNTELISLIANLVVPGAGGVVGSALGQQQEC